MSPKIGSSVSKADDGTVGQKNSLRRSKARKLVTECENVEADFEQCSHQPISECLNRRYLLFESVARDCECWHLDSITAKVDGYEQKDRKRFCLNHNIVCSCCCRCQSGRGRCWCFKWFQWQLDGPVRQ